MSNYRYGKLKLFISNFFVYGVGGILVKIVPFIMLPIITRLMPSSFYLGISDMVNTIVSFAASLAVFGMYDAMYRLFFDKNNIEFQKKVCSTALVFTLINSVIISLVFLLFKDSFSNLFFGSDKYSNLFYIIIVIVFFTAINNIIAAPIRMQNKRRLYIILNITSSVLLYLIAVLLLLNKYYYFALPIATALSTIFLVLVSFFINKSWFGIKKFDKNILKKMLYIAVPLLPNFLVYWIFNSMDRIAITNLLGIDEVGIYAIGSKIGGISQLIYMAFAGGWQYFAFSTMKEENQVKSNSLVFEYLGLLTCIFMLIVSTFSHTIISLLFDETYIKAYISVPYLFMCPLLLMLFQVSSNQFLVIKKTWPNFFILLVGAILNVILNYCLIPVLGIEGAAISSLFGYLISNVLAIIVLLRMKLMIVNKKLVLNFALILFYIVFWRSILYNNFILNIFVMFIFIFIYLFIYRNDILIFITCIKNILRKRDSC